MFSLRVSFLRPEQEENKEVYEKIVYDVLAAIKAEGEFALVMSGPVSLSIPITGKFAVACLPDLSKKFLPVMVSSENPQFPWVALLYPPLGLSLDELVCRFTNADFPTLIDGVLSVKQNLHKQISFRKKLQLPTSIHPVRGTQAIFTALLDHDPSFGLALVSAFGYEEKDGKASGPFKEVFLRNTRDGLLGLELAHLIRVSFAGMLSVYREALVRVTVFREQGSKKPKSFHRFMSGVLDGTFCIGEFLRKEFIVQIGIKYYLNSEIVPDGISVLQQGLVKYLDSCCAEAWRQLAFEKSSQRFIATERRIEEVREQMRKLSLEEAELVQKLSEETKSKERIAVGVNAEEFKKIGDVAFEGLANL